MKKLLLFLLLFPSLVLGQSQGGSGVDNAFRVPYDATNYTNLTTNSSGEYVIAATGINVGINNTNPAYTLHIGDGNTAPTYPAIFLDGQGTNDLRLSTGGAVTAITSTPRLDLYGSATLTATLINGNFGINTIGADRKLDVLDASNPQFRLTYTDGSVYTDFQTNSSGYLTIAPTGGSVIFPAGTGTSPGIAFGDGDTGFYEPGDDTLYISLGGTTRYYLSSGAFNSSIATGFYLKQSGATDTTPTICPYSGDPNTGIGHAADDQLSLIAGGVEGFRITEDTSITNTTFGVIRSSTSLYNRYYHLPLGSFNPGASGATWTNPDANTVGGWDLDAAGETLQFGFDVHGDWDGATDLKVEVLFAINTAGADSADTVDLKLVCYYNGIGETSTKTQTVEVPTTIGTAAQYTTFETEFPIDWDLVSHVVEAGDHFGCLLNLETDTSEVDDIVILQGGNSVHYMTTHLGIEDGDT